MKTLKSRDNFILILSGTIIVLALSCYIYPHFFAAEVKKEIEIEKEVLLPTPKVETTTKPNMLAGPTYNYQNMIGLIEKFRKYEQSFYVDFEKFVKKPENLENLHLLLFEFKKERFNFREYTQKIRTFYRRVMPTKKRNALRYYMLVIEEDIDGLEEMIEKLKIQNDKRLSS